jgi:cytosine/uracil/thiamine/allantoin permease
MIVDYYLIKRGSYEPDILHAKGGRYWYRGGVNWLAVGAWVVGAVLAYVWAYVWPLPFGATVPSFIVTFVLYLLLSLPGRTKGQFAPARSLATADDAR